MNKYTNIKPAKKIMTLVLLFLVMCINLVLGLYCGIQARFAEIYQRVEFIVNVGELLRDDKTEELNKIYVDNSSYINVVSNNIQECGFWPDVCDAIKLLKGSPKKLR